MSPVVYGGQLVAIAGRERCHVLYDLDAEDLRVVLLMCHFLGAALRAGVDVADVEREAEAWARRAADPTPAISTRR
jgi:hypothetical protein